MRCCLCLLTLCALGLPARADENKDDEPDVVEGKVRLTLETGGHNSVIAKALFTPDNSQLITLATDQVIRVWDVASGECVNVLYPPLLMHSQTAKLSPDGRLLAVSRVRNDDGKRTSSVLLIALPEGRIERVLAAPTGAGMLAFSPNGKRLATPTSGGKAICLWDMEQQKAEPDKTIPLPGVSRTLAFSPDGTRVALSGEWSGVMDVEDGKPVRKLFAGAPGDKVAWSPDGKTIAYATAASGLRLWDPDGKQPRLILEDKVRFSAVTFNTDSKTILASEFGAAPGSDRVRAYLYGVAGGKPRKTFVGEQKKPAPPGKPAPPPPAQSVDEVFHDSTLSPDGQLAAAVGRRGGSHEVLIWRTSDAQVTQRLASRAFYGVPDAIVGWAPNGKSLIWNQGPAARGFLLEDLPKQEAKPGGKAFPGMEGLRLIAKPPAPAPALATEQGGLKFVPPNGETSFTIAKGNQAKFATVKTGTSKNWHATFFGKDQVAVHAPFSVVNANNGNKVRDLTGHNSYVLNFGISPNHKYLASASWDQVIRVHAVDQTEPLFSLYVVGRDWVMWTPKGYYAASPGGERMMGWVVETSPDEMATFHPASRFRARFYRNDVMRLLLKEGSLEAALKKADEARGIMNSKVADVNKELPPKVEIKTSAKLGTKIKDGKLHIDVEAIPQGEDPITALQLNIDGRPYTGKDGLITIEKPKKGPVTASWDVVLPPGAHDVMVLARTEVALSSSRGLTYEAESDKPPAKTDPALYILAVGIDAYPGRLRLGGAVNDANKLVEAFQKHAKPPFREVEAKVVLDKDATRDGMRKGLEWLKSKQTASDIAIFFYAGHGDRDKDDFYLLPQDIDANNIGKTGLSRAEIKKSLQGIPGRILVILDACHSGAVGVLFDDLSRELNDEDCGVVVICAAVPSETAGEKNGRGNLTLSITEALSGESKSESLKISKSPKDKCVYLHHLQQYIIDRVVELSDDKQHATAVMPPWLKSFSLSKP